MDVHDGGGAASALLGVSEGLLVLTELGHSVDDLVSRELGQSANTPGCKTKTDSSHVHAEAQGSGGEEDSEPSVANHEELNVKLSEEDDPEPEVAEWALEDVEVRLVALAGLFDGALFNFNLSWHGIKDTAVDHVEKVHHDEGLEEESLVKHAEGSSSIGVLHLSSVKVVLDIEHLGSKVGKDEHSDDLEDGLEENLANHGLSDDLVFCGNALFGDLVGVGVLSGESNGGKNIHDQVDPEELHNVEGRVTEENSSGDDVDHASDVDSDLVLDKLADVVLNVTSPSDGGDNSHEVVVHKDDVSMVLGGGASVLSHGETNVGLAKGTRVGETFTSDGDACLRLSKGTGEHVFQLWGGSVDNHHGFLEISLEALHGFGVNEIVRSTTTLIFVLTFFHERSEIGQNIGSRVAEFSLVDVIGELNLDGGGHDGHLAVTREDSDVGATVTELVDSIIDTFSERIGEADSGDHGKVILNDSARLFGLEVAILHLEGLEVLGTNVNVSESKSLETGWVVDRLAVIDGGGGATDDDFLSDSFADVVSSLMASTIERASLSIGVKSTCAHWDNDFGGTLNDDTGSLALVESVGDSHALAIRAERNPELEVVLVFTLNELVLDGDALAGDELEETDIDGAADSLVSIFFHLHGSIAVEDDGLLQGLLELNVSLEVAGVEGLSLGGNTFDLHVTSGKGSGLSGKDVNDLTSSLKCV